MEPFSYSLKDVALIVKRHTHEVRNALNGMELELTLLDESALDPGVREAVKRLRTASGEINRLLQCLSSKYGLDAPCSVPAIQIAERWSADARHLAADATLQWNIVLGSETVQIESSLVRALLQEALEMALRVACQRSLQINCRRDQARIIFEIIAMDNKSGAGIVDSQNPYWAALRRLAERSGGVMHPVTLSTTHSFPMQLSFPLHPPPSFPAAGPTAVEKL